MTAPDDHRAGSPAAVSDDLDALLVRVAHADEAAFTQLYDVVIGRVYGLARRIMRDDTLAEEVAQEVMVQLWHSASTFDRQRGSAIGWILLLAHRRAVDRVRAESSRRAREQRDAARSAVQSPLDEGLIDADDRREVQAALDALTSLQREAVELAYYQGYTYRQVAQVLDVPEGTAKARLRDGLRKLRDQLGGAVA